MEYLYHGALLPGQAIIVEIDIILYIFDTDVQFGSPPFYVEFTSDSHSTCFPEIIVPNEVIGSVFLIEIRRFGVFEKSISP